jgi:hypothetical protein
MAFSLRRARERDKRDRLPSGRVELPVRGLIGLWLHSKLVLSAARPTVRGRVWYEKQDEQDSRTPTIDNGIFHDQSSRSQEHCTDKERKYYGNLQLFGEGPLFLVGPTNVRQSQHVVWATTDDKWDTLSPRWSGCYSCLPASETGLWRP